MEVKILSKENIMPSSPTPPHLKTFQLSLLDQFSPVLYTPLIIFYPMNNKDDPRHHQTHEKLMATLKNSLSKTLSHFYLLAGRIVDKSIRCSDEGAVFIEATVSCGMSEILKQPNNEFLMKLIPCSERCTEPVEEYAHVVVQANVFVCGGVAISLCLLHKLMDATTISCFLKCWATINRSSFTTINLTFNDSTSELLTPSSMTKDNNDDPFSKMVCYDYKSLSSLFPQTNFLPFHPRLHETLSSNSEEESSFQRFVFKEKAILDLKAKAKSNDVPNPTSVEVLSGFIWKCALEAASTKLGLSQIIPSVLTHAMNLRKRMEPPLPEFSVGNIFWNVVAHYSANKETQVELSELVSLIRQSFVDINNGNYIKKLVGDEGSKALVKLVWERNMLLFKVPKLYICTSWRNMDLNEVNFGWGKPIWIGSAGNSNTTIKNMIVLLDDISSDGVEAWMILEKEEMEILLQNQEFLNFALLNPAIPIECEE